MLSLNKYQYTKSGEKVMPLIVSGDTVQCVDLNGMVVMKSINDFENEPDKKEVKEKVIEVSPIEEKNTDVLIDKNEADLLQYQGELFTEEDYKVNYEDELNTPVNNKTNNKNRYVSDEKYI